MSIFGGYDQAGPGVYKSEQREGPTLRFLRIVGLKFFTLCLCNLLFVAINLPALGITYFVAAILMPFISSNLSAQAVTDLISQLGLEQVDQIMAAEEAAFGLYWISVFIGSFFIVGLTLIVMGPFQTAFSYVYRNYARESSGFFWQDFSRALKSNWKQSLIVSTLSFFITVILLFNIAYYATHLSGLLSQILLGMFAVLFMLYCCIQMYVYPLIASLDLPLKKIYRNAMVFTGIRFFPTLGILILQTLILMIIPAMLFLFGAEIGSTIAVIFYLMFAFSFSHFLSNFFVWHQIEKHMLPAESEESSNHPPDSKQE